MDVSNSFRFKCTIIFMLYTILSRFKGQQTRCQKEMARVMTILIREVHAIRPLMYKSLKYECESNETGF